jgi:hypothetical protein
MIASAAIITPNSPIDPAMIGTFRVSQTAIQDVWPDGSFKVDHTITEIRIAGQTNLL